MIRRAAALTLAAAALLAPAAARADDAPFVDYPSWLPALPFSQFHESTFDACADGSPTCVGETLEEMNERLRKLVVEGDCDHNAVFALTYIYVTDLYARAVEGEFPSFQLEEPEFFAHEDAVFAQLYFDAYDAWAAGDLAKVPQAWQIAFDAARDRRLSAVGNMLQGINAHVQRDMPFMLAGLGIVKPDGSTRKRDHDAFNALLNTVFDDVIAAIAERFDRTTAYFDQQATVLDNFIFFQLLPLWREMVWRHAEALVNAPNEAARAAVAQEIEQYAANAARFIETFTKYNPALGQSQEQRDGDCRAYHAANPL